MHQRGFLASGTAVVALTLPGAVLAGLAPARAAGAATIVPSGPRTTVPGSHPFWAVSSRQLGSAPVTSGAVYLRVYLAGRDPAGLTAYADAVAAPGSPRYGQFLTPAAAMSRFGPTSAQVGTVRRWLRSAGLAITSVRASAAAGAYVAASGPVAAAGRAFAVSFRTYRGPDGRRDRAPAGPATVPALVGRSVLSVTGLDTARHEVQPALPPPGPNDWSAPPCSRYYAQRIARGQPRAAGRHRPWELCGYRPRQLRAAYGVTASGRTGAGQTVAIIDAYRSPTMLADAARYARVTGDPPLRPGQYMQYQAGPFSNAGASGCNAPHWYGEQTLDVEALHGLAPDAKLRYVAAGSCSNDDLINALALVVNRRLASIVSDSWSSPADSFTTNATFDAIFKLGAVEGIGFYFATGDHGYNAPRESPGQSDQIQVDYPSSDPGVTAVGGTSLAIGKRRDYQFETSWGSIIDPLARDQRSWAHPPPGRYPSGYNGSGGGGVSVEYRQPGYQRGIVPERLATHLPDGKVSPEPMRVIPDVSAVADPSTGLMVGQTTLAPDRRSYAFSLSVVGGTSLACPVFAAIQADAQQAAGRAFGFANPLLYSLYRTGAFHDVTDHPLGPRQLYLVFNAYSNPSARQGPIVTILTSLGINGRGAAALRAVPGYDDATGMGSPGRYLQSFRP